MKSNGFHSRGVRQKYAGKIFAIVLFSVIATLILAEVGLRLFVPSYRFMDPQHDEFWIAEFSSRELSRQRFAKDKQYDPNFGWRMQSDFSSVDASHNSMGYRGDVEYKNAKSRFRIVALGDSFTYGLGVGDNDTFAAIIGRQSKVEVINTGVTGFGADQAFLMWEHEAKALSPDIVIFGYFVDDFNRNVLSFREGPKPYFSYNKAEDRLVMKGIPVPTFDAYFAAEQFDAGRNSRVIQLLGQAKRRLKMKLGDFRIAESDQRVEISHLILRQLAASVDSIGAKLLVVLIGHCVDGSSENVWVEQEILKSLLKSDIQFINMAQEMRNEEMSTYYLENCHWSERGHRFAAAKILEALDLKSSLFAQ